MGVPLALATATSVSPSVRRSVHIKLLDVELVLSSPRYNDGIMVAFTGDISTVSSRSLDRWRCDRQRCHQDCTIISSLAVVNVHYHCYSTITDVCRVVRDTAILTFDLSSLKWDRAPLKNRTRYER